MGTEAGHETPYLETRRRDHVRFNPAMRMVEMIPGATLIDFTVGVPTAPVEYSAHLRVGDVIVARCSFAPNPGIVIGSSQLAIAIHTGGTLNLTSGYELHRETHRIAPGMVSIMPANYPLYLAWDIPVSDVIVVAVEQMMVSRIINNAGINASFPLIPQFGLEDQVIMQLARTCDDQIDRQGSGGRTFAEGLATALVTHIYKTYAGSGGPTLVKGGLTPLDTQRVISFIESNLHQNIGLEEIAATVQLSTHYFTEAFRKTVGIPPYRFLLTKRIERAKELLLRSDLATGKIAEEVGFSSQAQFTTNFRKMVGKTPGRFRREST